MKVYIFFLLLIFSLGSPAQTIEKFYDYNWKACEPDAARFYSSIHKTDSGYVRKDYFIHEKSLQMIGKYHDADTKVQNGYFHYFHPNKVLDGSGKYLNGKKEGLWLHYHPNGMLLDSTVYSNGKIIGTSLSWHSNGYLQDSITLKEDGSGVRVTWFDNGNLSSAGFVVNNTKPHATWKYYHKNGELSSVETYNNGVLISKSYFDENGKALNDTSNIDKEAAFAGGVKAWQKYLLKKIYFPDQFKITNSDKAVVVVSFVITEEGKVEDIHVSVPFYREFDKIAKNAVVKSPDWAPAVNHNRKVKIRVRQPIVFSQTYD